MLRERITTLKPWKPDDPHTRLLSRVCEQRRLVVGNQTKTRQQLLSVLKQYFPLVLTIFGKPHQQDALIATLLRYSDPRQLRSADRRVVRRLLNEHVKMRSSIRFDRQKRCVVMRLSLFRWP